MDKSKTMDIKSEDPNQNRVILEETFFVLNKKNCVFRVKLTKAGVCLSKESEENVKEQLISINDIIGCQCLRGKKQTRRCACQALPHSSSLQVVEDNSLETDISDISAYLYIYAYTFQGTRSSKKRERTVVTLRFRSFDKYEDNYKEAQRWRTAIKTLIKGGNISSLNFQDFSIVNKDKELRRLLVLCNPKSGPGKGKQIFQEKVAPILHEAEIPYDLHMTKHANYARQFVREANLFQWSGIVVVGGDGIVFEVINGIFERWDWSEVVKSIPIGVIPGGSGNGLARSIAHHSCEPYLQSPALPAALAAVRNHYCTMDLVRVETTSQIMFSFLSVGWGFLSDLDIESERLRILGGTRFTVWSIARLIGLRSYKGKVWYLPADVPIAEHPKMIPNITSMGSNLDLVEVNLETSESRQRVDSWYSANSRKSAYFSTADSSYQSTADSGGYGDPPPIGDKPRMYGPASQLPCLTAALPSTWKCLSGTFVMVHASYQSHLGEDCYFAPDARLNDGTIWLLIIKGDATRSQVLHFLLGLSTGAHAAAKNLGEGGPIELIPVNAFRIEPDVSENGFMTVDGEHVEYGPIQAEIFPELARVMVP